MRRQPLSMKRYLLITVFALFFLATTVIAQETTDNDDATPTTAETTDAGETDTAAPPVTTGETTADDEATTTEDSDATTTANTDEATTTDATTTEDNTSEATTTDDATTTAESTAESTATSTDDATTTSEETAPPITSTGTESAPTVPTLSGQYSYPPPSVPPTNNAPFMRPNKVPEGTFFIAVGAVLGAFGAAVLIWRGIVVWQLHRNVKRAALAQQMSNDKLAFAPPAAPFYKYTDRESAASLGNTSQGRGVRRTQRGPIPSGTPSQTNLFFSPTAPGANSASNRESRFLPSGFYAAGAGSSQQQQGHGHSISLTNLRPDSRGHARAVGHSPPDSPSLAPRPEPARRNMSTSTLNLTRPTSGRAPSAYLDDLLADQPDQFPPPHANPAYNNNSNNPSQNSRH